MFRRFAAWFVVLFALAACSDSSKSNTAMTSSPPAPEVGVVKANLEGDETVSLDVSDTAPESGESVSFTARAPVIDDQSLVSQTITGTWDAHFKLNGPPVVPEGWTTTYFAGSTDLGGIPTTPAGWASVTSVSATGNYQSDGSLNGAQYVVGTTSATPPPAAASFSGGSAGDGWNIWFSPDRTKVYNAHHHDSPANIMCRNASDGTVCSTGWPFGVYHTSDRSTGWVDPETLYLWHESFDPGGNGGWECIDTAGATPASCTTRFVAAFPGATHYNHHMDLQNVGRELYSMDMLHGALTCLNLDGDNGQGAPCAGQPYAGFGGTNATNSGLRAIAGKIYVLVDGQIKCFDPATKAACAAMQWPQAGSDQPITPVPSGDGVVRNLCTRHICYALDGTSSTLTSAFSDHILANPPQSCCGNIFIGQDSAETRVFFPYTGEMVDCFDTQTDLRCPGFPVTVTSAYSAVVDPLNSNCLWTNGHDGVIRTWNIPDGTSGCTSPPPSSIFKPALAVPRLACNGSHTISGWDKFELVAPASTAFTSATLTIKNSIGVPINGWENLPLDGNHPVDIRTLDLAATGQTPTFEINYVDLTDTSSSSARFRVLGQSPEVCWSATAQAACPSGVGLLPTPLPATSPTEVTASGSSALSNNPSVPFQSTTRTITAPNETSAETCGAALSGTLTGPDSLPLRDVVVELLDSDSAPVLDGDAPIVATTGADGTYTFPPLLIGSYRLRVTSVRDHWAVSSVTVVTGGSGTATAANDEVTSDVITLSAGLTGQADASFTGPIDEDGDGIPNYVEKGPDLDNPIDTDGDSVADYLDLDSDEDSITDAIESNNDGSSIDTDGDTVPDRLDLDSDDDGISDKVETSGDPDGDDIPNRRDSDSDDDGLPDVLERGASGVPVDSDGDETPDYLDLDSDGDELTDRIESNSGSVVDTDQDGTPDRLDLDSDDDGIPDRIETHSDPDDDNIANYRDLDSDGDGISDEREGNLQGDGDEVSNYLDLDSDGDTIPDSVEQGVREELLDTDDDGLPNYLDEDSDSDGIPDMAEAGGNGQYPRDSDGDEVHDYLDLDSDDDSIPDAMEKGTGDTLADTDQDETADYVDSDSDNDGVEDSVEAGADGAAPRDTDGDALPDYVDLDSDDDDILDSVESGSGSTPSDSDGDGEPDMLDLDSDADGILDASEGSADPDRDNLGSWIDPDSDGDLISDEQETDGDADGDNVPNYLDGDSDDDGVRDVLEAGTDPSKPRDTDSDEAPDYLDDDADNDCVPDRLESASGILVATAPNTTASDNCTEAGNDRCDTARGACTKGCAVDSDCGDATSGSICDDNTHACAPGCRNDGNQCAGGDVCSVTNGSLGTCLVDTDGDGIPDEIEEERGLNPNTDDSDGDGIPDSVEAVGGVAVDTDRDSVPDVLDTDADGDGVADRLEVGNDPRHPRDTDKDGVPDYLDLDGDGDGWPDSVERAGDSDGDGIPDYMDPDSDGDGVSDADEFAWGFRRNAADSDGDGISDADEVGPGPGALDTDADGRPDAVDLDADNDSLQDSVERGEGEGPADFDGDGIPDYRDLDTDNDGITDKIEARDSRDQVADSDGDGSYDYRDSDSDNDSLSDESEGSTDTDNDGVANYRDLDSDNDCLTDQAEAAEQTQRDASKPNALASDNCPAEAPICSQQTGVCITAERTPPRECRQDNAISVCLSGECDAATNKCVPVGCTSDAACGTGMYCDSNTMTCTIQLSAGDKLRADEIHGGTCTSELAAKMCESGVCNSFTNRCANKDGDSCTEASECASNACLEGVCVSKREVPTVSRLSGGCSALSGATGDNAWVLLSALGGIGLWLRRPKRRKGGPAGRRGNKP